MNPAAPTTTVRGDSGAGIAIVGLGCQYPDAASPVELWENVLAQRRAFRRLPAERLRGEDYYAPDPAAPDRTYSVQAALIDGFEFDRVKFKIMGSTFRSADWAHWVALEVASRALLDAGYPDGSGLPRETTGVVLGNTLTGEFSRASVMRLRWPYVRRVVAARLEDERWEGERRNRFLDALEAAYKSPFPPVGEETLAGGLSNTIAGRICNTFDLNGGGYTIDGACASSLLAVANACASLSSGDLDVALAGGVDLSLDPFELVGFAKTGALAPEEMRVYDARSAGFWPGEGCGFAVLMRYGDAVAEARKIYAVIRGWGVSSDGAGGITRPEENGQLHALRRAYRRAGFGIGSVAYFEGHGTGTRVGDDTELRALVRARRAEAASAVAAFVGSIKANIGHTKAAAGIAGLIKASMALHTQIIPPSCGAELPHAELSRADSLLRLSREALVWPSESELRAGVSAMGFGGINSHVVLEGTASSRRQRLSPRELDLCSSAQEMELLLFGAMSIEGLKDQLEPVAAVAPRLSRSELTDLSVQLARSAAPGPTVRAALIAGTPQQLADRLLLLLSWLAGGRTSAWEPANGLFLGHGAVPPRIGFLFPGQGSPARQTGGALARRFPWIREWYDRAILAGASDPLSTEVAQPALCLGSLVGLRLLEQAGIAAGVGLGHSLGELGALHWAGVIDDQALLRIAVLRGKAMAQLGTSTGAMAAIAAPADSVLELLQPTNVWIVGLNSPRQTVVSGESSQVQAVMAHARARGWLVTQLPVSQAFHTPLVSGAIPAFQDGLRSETFSRPQRAMVSTVEGAWLGEQQDVPALLKRQITAPVRFIEAVLQAAPSVDLWIEVGAGRVLTGLVQEFPQPLPSVALDIGASSLIGWLETLGAAFALGAPVNPEVLFAGRITRPFDIHRERGFFINPCELAPVMSVKDQRHPEIIASGAEEAAIALPSPDGRLSPWEVLRRLISQRTELPLSAVREDSRMLSDLHLNSITVGQLVTEASRLLGLPPLVGVTEFANATVSQIATALTEHAHTRSPSRLSPSSDRSPPGVSSWVRLFCVELVPTRRPAQVQAAPGSWRVFAPLDHPLRLRVTDALAQQGGGGVLVLLPAKPRSALMDEEGTSLETECLGLLLAAARAVLEDRVSGRFVLLQDELDAGGFARTLHLETPGLTTCVVTGPFDHPECVRWMMGEIEAAHGYLESCYNRDGERAEPRVRCLASPELPTGLAAQRGHRTGLPTLAGGSRQPDGLEVEMTAGDVLLVTGGGKGIAAECALELAARTGVKLALFGRSDPAVDSELAANLARIEGRGAVFRYYRADVTDVNSVARAVARATAELGPITALLHGAGKNHPALIGSLDQASFDSTLRPKTQGLRNVLAAVNPQRLRLLVTFGSIIARTGLQGEADYAVANGWLRQLTAEFQEQYPDCHCLCLEWSIWSGVGMGQRLGRVEMLSDQGISAISPEIGVAAMMQALGSVVPGSAVVISGRFGDPPTLKQARPDLPLLRFLETPRVFYPGVELVVDSRLALQTDPYLADHMLHGERLFPAVLGLEAMAQAARVLAGSENVPQFESVRLLRPIIVPSTGDGSTTIRLAALAQGPGRVEVCLRSEDTGFQIDHFRAICVFGDGENLDPVDAPSARCRREKGMEAPAPASATPSLTGRTEPMALDPVRDLYSGRLFHSGRFRRIRGYRHLRSQECWAEIAVSPSTPWFGPYLPHVLILGDPGVRDAAIHAIQACIPHQRVLPVGVSRIWIREPSEPDSAAQPSRADDGLLLHAIERGHHGDRYEYDLELLTPDGHLLETWTGLMLVEVEPIVSLEPWCEALVGPYVERRLAELMPGVELAILLAPLTGSDRSRWRNAAVTRLIGEPVKITHRPDGKPERVRGRHLSCAYAGGLGLVVVGSEPLSCDLLQVEPRTPEAWLDLLGHKGLAATEVLQRKGAVTDLNAASAIVWTVLECLKKAGAPWEAPVLFTGQHPGGWLSFESGSWSIGSFILPVHTLPSGVALSVLCQRDSLEAIYIDPKIAEQFPKPLAGPA